MERIAWVIDSTGFLDEELLQNKDVFVVPIIVIHNGKEYRDGIDLSPAELHRLMREEKFAPTTSQPSVGTFVELYQKLEKNYDRIIAIHVSGKLSGTVTASKQAADMVSIPVHTFDSLIISYPMVVLMRKLMEQLSRNQSIKEAFDTVKKIRDSQETYVLIGSLEQLNKSGRLSGTQYWLGSLLKLKPIISIVRGELTTKAKERSINKAETRIFNLFKSAYANHKIKECCLLYGLSPEQTTKWREMILKVNSDIIIHMYPLGTAIGVHTGPQTIGISWFNEE